MKYRITKEVANRYGKIILANWRAYCTSWVESAEKVKKNQNDLEAKDFMEFFSNELDELQIAVEAIGYRIIDHPLCYTLINDKGKFVCGVDK